MFGGARYARLIIKAERPISLTVWAPAAISIPRKSARADLRF